ICLNTNYIESYNIKLFKASENKLRLIFTLRMKRIQPHLKVFPRTLQGDRRRQFQASWYNLHPWIEYSQCQDSVYCFACRNFGLLNTHSVFTSVVGYKNWKKATFRDGGFAGHAKSEAHINAMMAWKEFERRKKTDSSLMSILNKEHKKQIEENRTYIKTVAEVLMLTATQNISQRGHRETADADNKGNFLEILNLIGDHDPTVKKKLAGPQNAKYTSHHIQNEILDTLAEMVCVSIINEVKESEVFAIMADETKDTKKKEQISLVLRYYYQGAVKESFLHFEAAEHLDAAGLTEKIIHILEKYGLDYRSNLVGQAYDGASVMSGKHSGVQSRIKEVAKQAFYVHCNAHCLNLVLVDTVKAVPQAECFFTILQRLYSFMSGSYVHIKWLDIQKEMYDGPPRELQKLSDTRWACQHMACNTVLKRLPTVIRLLEEISEEKSGDRTVDARVLLAQMDLEFIGLLVTFTELFGDTRCLSDILQSPSLDLGSALDLIEALMHRFQCYRDESYFEGLWKDLHGYVTIILERKAGIQKPTSVVDLTVLIEPFKEVFHKLFKLCKIAVAIPVSTAACERSFSTLKLVKSYLRSTMNDERLSNLGVLSVESRRAKSLNFDEFVNNFALKHNNRRIQLM
uniref:TTF-type domain-containing protein n=1 Tax=Esox lucius TaxID=8010 RepID=A0A6Q2XCH7_ESOLU